MPLGSFGRARGRAVPRRLCAVAIALTLGGPAAAASLGEITCGGPDDVCRDNATMLPLMALPRPFSNIYSTEEASRDAILAANVRAFYPLYVFDRKELDLSDPANPTGWYRVGTTVRRPFGWMQAGDLLEWHQALVVAYTHPGSGDQARQPVLMFGELPPLSQVVEADARADQAQALYDTLDAGGVPAGVVSAETSRYRDIDKDFYIFPVIDFDQVHLFDDPARYLQVAAAIPRERSVGADQTTLDNTAYRDEVAADILLERTVAEALAVDIVFVMDMTSSMGPYIDRTKTAIARIAELVLNDAADREKVRFGLIGYRDNATIMPGLQFTTRLFTPSLVDSDGLARLLTDEAGPAGVGSEDYPEEVFAGVDLGLKAPWTGDRSLKFVILVGDASGHEPGHRQATLDIGPAELRQLADQLKVRIAAIHLLDPAARSDHEIARDQFRILSRNPGAESALYYDIPTQALDRFETVVGQLAGSLSAVIGAARTTGGASARQVAQAAVRTGGGDPGIGADPAIGGADPGTQDALAQTIESALVEYLGDQASAPRDIVAWTFDRDLIDPVVPALSVRVLLTREQVNNLIIALEAVVTAMKEAELTKAQFFSALQAVVTQTIKTADDINFDQARRLSETRLMPRWIESLPYRSEVLAMSDAIYEALTADERVALERKLEAKLALYREINENTDLWHALADDTAESQKVTPLAIDMLP